MANDVEKRVTCKMVLDSSGFNQSLQGVNQQLKVAQSELKASSAQVGLFGTQQQKSKTMLDGLTKQIDLQRQKIDIYRTSIDDATTKMNKNIAERDRLKTALEQEKIKLEAAIKTYGKESEVVTQLKRNIDDITEEYNKKEKAVQSNAKTIQNYVIQENKAKEGLTKLQAELKKTSSEIATNENKWLSAGNTLKNTAEKMKSAGDKISSVGASLTVGVTAPIVGIGVAATKMAMDAIESENLFEVSMGDMAESARKWSEETSKSLGLNAYEVRKNVGTFNVMLTSMGQTNDQALSMSENMTQLAYDMASFYNLKPEEAFEKLRAGISGETEPLKSLGILISDNAVKTYAYTQGIAEQGKELTDAQKVQARYGLIMQSTAKAQGDLARTMDSPTNKLRIQTEQIKQQAIELGTKLIPILSDLMGVVKKVVDWYSGLNDAQKDTIIKFAMTAAALGPVTSGFGNLLKVGGGVASVIGKISTAMGTAEVATAGVGTAAEVAAGTAGAGGVSALATSLGGAALAAAPWIVAGAAVAGTGYLIYKGMTQEAIPAVDLFADKYESTVKTIEDANGQITQSINTTTIQISEGTKKAVGAYMELDNSAKQALSNLYVNSTVVTGQIVTDTVGKYNEMASQIKASIDKRFSDEFKAMQDFYANSSVLTDAEEAEALSKMQNNNATQKAEEDKRIAEIKAILDKASAEKRALTLAEQQQINSIQQTMRTNAVKTMSDSEVEQKVILERLKGYGERITAEQASAEIKNANDARDKTVAAADEKYNKTVAAIIRQRDESHTITADQADKLIADAERQRSETVTKAEDMRKQAVDKITSMNSDITKNVDTNTGNILTAWDKLKTWWDSWWPKPKTVTVNTSGVDLTGSNVSYGTSFGYIPQHASGTNYFQGGLTTLHEKGWEIYDLPRGTRIYNHEASEDIAIKTAEKVAKGVLNEISNTNNGEGITIIIPVNLDGKEISRYTEKRQGQNIKLAGRGQGL